MSKKETEEDKWEKFKFISDHKELITYLNERSFDHKNYHHYTKLKTAGDILGNSEFWLKNVGGFNDLEDRAQFAPNIDYTFAICFSIGKYESIPMWYLYSGVQGNGARLSLTIGNMKNLLNNPSLVLYNNRTKKSKSLDAKTLKYRDIVYYSENTSKPENARLKYADNVNNNMSEDEFKTYRSTERGFCKKMIWDYEREFRILVEITDEKLKAEMKDTISAARAEAKATQKKFDFPYVVKLPFGQPIKNSIKLTFAPEIKDLSGSCESNENIKDFLELKKIDTSSKPTWDDIKSNEYIRPSVHMNKINMNLCHNCTESPQGNK